jgi:hypothetical protein
MALGDGIRRNIGHVDPTERALLRDAILQLNQRYFPGSPSETPPGGVSWWFKQDEIHQATHVHGGPEFLPWHREITNRFEEMLRQINPQLSLHYWDFREDPRAIPNANLGGGNVGTLNLFDATFMGSPGIQENVNPAGGEIGEPWLSAGFYDPQAGTSGHPQDRDNVGGTPPGTPADPPKFVMRPSNYPPGPPPKPLITAQDESNILALQNWGPGLATNDSNDPAFRAIMPNFFRTAWERIHNRAHPYFADISPHDAFRDPFVFLVHSNVDRLFAMWQTDPNHPERLDPNTVYGSESNLDVNVNAVGVQSLQNLTHQVEPWSTGHGQFHDIRPWEPTHENQGVPHTYHDISVVAPPCYNTNQSTFRIDEAENPFNAITNRFQVIFHDVPEEETTWRAAVIRIYTCNDTTFRVEPGTEPGAPFGVAVGQVTALHGAHPHGFQDVRLWFSYTAGAVGSAPHSDGPVNTTITLVETGQQFLFELHADTIHRPTVAVQMVLDQSGSMSDPAGTSGLTRLAVLKDAANVFATVIQNNNGLGIVRFDQDAYPPNDPTFGGMVITRILSDAERNTAHAAINAHGAHGATSVGDGLIMGHSQIVALPAGAYDSAATLLLTDGLENQPQTIADAIGMGAVDSRTFAIGLGNEFQVNTAALNAIAGSTGGNLLLSGILSNGTDDFFRVKKFFLQILASVTNTSIVRDPTGYINVGTRIKVPFWLSEADINCRLILLTDYAVVNLAIETPDGNLIDEANAAGFGVTFQTDGTTKTSLFNLPVVFQANSMQAGVWNAILEIDETRFKRTLSVLRDRDPRAEASLQAKGARYCLSTHSFSNLRMNAVIFQNSYDPGSNFTLRARLSEYNLPIDRRATVTAHVEYPDHTTTSLPLAETQPGLFETATVGAMTGIYHFRVEAGGVTYRGTPFSREQLLTGAIFRGTPEPPGQPIGSIGRADLCHLFSCLVSEDFLTPRLEESLREKGLELAAVRKCLELFCRVQ